jgi:hypothetical protein
VVSEGSPTDLTPSPPANAPTKSAHRATHLPAPEHRHNDPARLCSPTRCPPPLHTSSPAAPPVDPRPHKAPHQHFMPAARPDRSARRTFRSACLRLGLRREESSVLHTTTMPLRSSTNAAHHHAPAIDADHNLGATSVSHHPKLSSPPHRNFTPLPSRHVTTLRCAPASHDALADNKHDASTVTHDCLRQRSTLRAQRSTLIAAAPPPPARLTDNCCYSQ